MQPILSRRDWLKLAAAGVSTSCLSGWLAPLATAAATNPQRKRACILLWMNGGPSQMDTFDLKPGHANGGPYKEIATKAPGLKISEHLPKLAEHGDRLAVVRSMTTKEGEHQRATFLLRTGQMPQGPIQYPPIGPLVAKELADPELALPPYVSIAPYRIFAPAAYGPGFLGPKFAPLVVGEIQFNPQQANAYEQSLKVQDLDRTRDIEAAQGEARLDILKGLQGDFLARRGGVSALSHYTAYERAVRLMKSEAGRAFDLDEEADSLRDAYGRNLFGQGCLLARRLVERGVPFVEVTHGGFNNNALGWDTHANNFDLVKRLSEILDPAWATLMTDLKARGLLDSTLIVWMGEFGRTPKINQGRGRDHYPNAWSTVLAGGGIKGGQAVGKTSADGTTVEERPVSVADFLATICGALGIDYTKQNQSNVGRPIRIVDKSAKPIQEVLA
jgi:hypothetical protein